MLVVGQKLWYVSKYRGSYEVTVEKIGRKWAYIGHRDRVDINTLITDGGNYTSPGRCYLSREAWEAESKVQNLWMCFTRQIGAMYNAPKGMTAEKIKEAREVLGMQA